jgi:hypothetical protein
LSASPNVQNLKAGLTPFAFSALITLKKGYKGRLFGGLAENPAAA